MVEPDAIDPVEAAMGGEAHMPLLAADGGFAALQTASLPGIEPAAVDALGDALLLMFASLVDCYGVVLHGLRCGLSKTKGGCQCQKSDAKQRNFHGGSPWRRRFWFAALCRSALTSM